MDSLSLVRLTPVSGGVQRFKCIGTAKSRQQGLRTGIAYLDRRFDSGPLERVFVRNSA